MPVTRDMLVTELQNLLRLTAFEQAVATVRRAQARTAALEEELAANAAKAQERSALLSEAIRRVGGVPDVVGSAIGKLGALATAQLNQVQTLQGALLGDLTLEHQLRERARYARGLAVSLNETSLLPVFDRLELAHTATIEWLETRLAEIGRTGTSLLRATPLQAVVSAARRVAFGPLNAVTSTVNQASALLWRSTPQQVQDVLSAAGSAAGSAVDTAVDTGISAARTATARTEAVAGAAGVGVEALVDEAREAVTGVAGSVSDSAEAVADTAGSVADHATALAGDAVNTVGDAVSTVGDAAASVASTAAGTAADAASTAASAASTVTGAATDAAGTVTEAVTGAAGTVTGAATDAAGTVTEAVTDAAGTVTEAAGDVLSTSAEAVTDAAGTVSEAAEDAAGTVTEAAADAAGTVSGAAADAAGTVAGAADAVAPGDAASPASEPAPDTTVADEAEQALEDATELEGVDLTGTGDVAHPFAGYEKLTGARVMGHIRDSDDVAELEQLLAFEAAHKARKGVLAAARQRLESLSSTG